MVKSFLNELAETMVLQIQPLVRCLSVLLLAVFHPVHSLFEPIRISAGELNPLFAYNDTNGNIWSPDQFFDGTGDTYKVGKGIRLTEDDVIYRTERFGPGMAYTVPVPPAVYRVNLHFCELFHRNAGERIFNVLLEGIMVIENLDVAAIFGGRRFRAYMETFDVEVADGFLNIDFNASGSFYPQITGFEIVELMPLIESSSAPSDGADTLCDSRSTSSVRL